jgi:hypothetical protein
MLHAFPFSHQPRAGHGAVIHGRSARPFWSVGLLLAEGSQPIDGVPLQPAMGQLLDAVGQPAFQKAAVGRAPGQFDNVLDQAEGRFCYVCGPFVCEASSASGEC